MMRDKSSKEQQPPLEPVAEVPKPLFVLTPSTPRNTEAPQIEVIELEGVERPVAEQWLAEVDSALAECRPTKPGLVHLRIVSVKNRTVIRIEGATVFSAETTECIMRAMSLLKEEHIQPVLLEPPEAITRQNPSSNPQRVMSHITISW
jgi:hypothetical protein